MVRGGGEWHAGFPSPPPPPARDPAPEPDAASSPRHPTPTLHARRAVIASEVIEHVRELPTFVRSLEACARPGAPILVTTINRTPAAYAAAILGAEYILKWVPQGTGCREGGTRRGGKGEEEVAVGQGRVAGMERPTGAGDL